MATFSSQQSVTEIHNTVFSKLVQNFRCAIWNDIFVWVGRLKNLPPITLLMNILMMSF